MPYKPRIAWFTPLSRKSAISGFSLLVTRRLAQIFDVDLWVPQHSDFELTTLPVYVLSQQPEISRSRMLEYDVAIYNMGNHFPFHGEIYAYLQTFPGIVILHDLVLHDFFHGRFISRQNGQPEYLDLIQRFYGDENRRRAELAFEGQAEFLWTLDQIDRFPLFEPAVTGAHAVVTHSGWAQARIRQVFSGPVQRIFLAYDQSRRPRELVPIRRERGRLLVVSVGLVQRHKRIGNIIKTLGENPDLARALQYVIVGSTSDQPYLRECQILIERYGLEDCVHFAGHASEHLLHSYLAKADICLNLRSPVTESGSASLAEAMLAAKPVVVLNTGCYRDVPDDCVLRIDESNEQAELADALRKLIADAELRRRIGENAYRFATENFTAEAYVAQLIPFLDRMRGVAPLLRSLDRVGRALHEMGTKPEMAIYNNVTGAFQELFSSLDSGAGSS